MKPGAFRLSDTLTHQIKDLVCDEPRHLRFYSCGPTVYSYAHIGNFRTFLTGDLIVRTAEALGWKVTYVSNITDVGHLTDDDRGEDRMAKGLASEAGKRFANVWDLAEHYARALESDWSRLNLREPHVRPRATQHMREQIVAIEELVRKGHAYETPLGVYFRVGSFEGYGKLSGNIDQDSLKRAVRDELVQDEGKEHPADFALWKRDEKHLMQWHSPWGWGFPGWHIECSVMAMKYLGESLDLHAGGEDLIFPHHECEIAQSEALTGKPFANHWVHTRFLQVEGEKMSKSKGNFFTASDLIDGKGADPLGLRYALISQNYGVPHNFTQELLKDATQKVERYRLCEQAADAAIRQSRPGEDACGESLRRLYSETLEAMCEDLNTSVALAKALEGTRVILREGDGLSAASGKSAKTFLDQVNSLLGIVRLEGKPPSESNAQHGVDPEQIERLLGERAEAKRSKDFARSDAIRAELEAMGLELRDTPDGALWRVRNAPSWAGPC